MAMVAVTRHDQMPSQHLPLTLLTFWLKLEREYPAGVIERRYIRSVT
jgi:hypothetical protein